MKVFVSICIHQTPTCIIIASFNNQSISSSTSARCRFEDYRRTVLLGGEFEFQPAVSIRILQLLCNVVMKLYSFKNNLRRYSD